MVMLFFLFSTEELRETFGRLGYDYGPDTAARNVAYYDRRTSHGSTLSFVTHAGVFAALDPESSWDRFLVALRSDVDDIQGGTTKEGIHLGVMAGTLDVVQRCYAGMRIRNEALYFDHGSRAGSAPCHSPCSSARPRSWSRSAATG
jgi:trehalose/maltose hydrolase-like predicted phosphorylase